MPTTEALFLTLFIVTFFVAIAAFASYGYLLVLLMRNHSREFDPKTFMEFLQFLWQLLAYYILRSLRGTFGLDKGKKIQFIAEKDRKIRKAETEQSRLIKVYSFFSVFYSLFFILLIVLFITFMYVVLNSFL